MSVYNKLAEDFFNASYQLSKTKCTETLDESLKGEIFALLFLSSKEKDISPSLLGADMYISTARITAILNNLENKKFIVREIDKKDRRKIKIKLTKTGKEEASRHKNKVIKQIIDMLMLLGEQDAKELIRITTKIVSVQLKKDQKSD